MRLARHEKNTAAIGRLYHICVYIGASFKRFVRLRADPSMTKKDTVLQLASENRGSTWNKKGR